MIFIREKGSVRGLEPKELDSTMVVSSAIFWELAVSSTFPKPMTKYSPRTQHIYIKIRHLGA